MFDFESPKYHTQAWNPHVLHVKLLIVFSCNIVNMCPAKKYPPPTYHQTNGI